MWGRWWNAATDSRRVRPYIPRTGLVPVLYPCAGTAHGAWGGVLREKNAPTTLPHPGRPPAKRCM